MDIHTQIKNLVQDDFYCLKNIPYTLRLTVVSEWLESGRDPEVTLQVYEVSSFTRVPSTERVDVCVPS